jgi:hypothetical protein
LRPHAIATHRSAIPAGILKQKGGEPFSAQELADLSAAFNAARASNQTAALNEYLGLSRDIDQPRQNAVD